MLVLVSYMGLAYNLALLFSSAQHFAVNLFFISSFFSQLQFTDGSQMSDFSQLINKQYICIYQIDKREKAYENLQITAKISLLQYAIQNRTRETTYTHSHHTTSFHTLIHITSTNLTIESCIPRNFRLCADLQEGHLSSIISLQHSLLRTWLHGFTLRKIRTGAPVKE